MLIYWLVLHGICVIMWAWRKEIKRRLKSDTCWACQYKSSLDSYRRKLPRCQKGLMEVGLTTWTGYRAASGGCPRWTLSFPCQRLRVMHSVDCLGFPQLLESRGPVPWVESLLSFLSTAFQRKCGHLRGESGKFWVLAQIAGQKEFHCHNVKLTKQAKGIFPYTSGTFGILSLFSGTLLWKFTYLSAPRKGEHSEKLLSKCDFFFSTGYLIPYLMIGLLVLPHREVIVTELLRLYAMRIRIIFNIIIWEYNKYSMAFSTDQLFVTAYYIVIKMLL